MAKAQPVILGVSNVQSQASKKAVLGMFVLLYYDRASFKHIRLHNSLSHLKQLIRIPCGKKKTPTQPQMILARFSEQYQESSTQLELIG